MKKIRACEKLLKLLLGQQSTVQAIQTAKLLGCFHVVLAQLLNVFFYV